MSNAPWFDLALTGECAASPDKVVSLVCPSFRALDANTALGLVKAARKKDEIAVGRR